MAGSSIEGLGHIFVWGADMFTKYGWSGAMLSSFGLGVGKVAELRGGGDALSTLASGRLIETTSAFGIGCGLGVIGGPMTLLGGYLASREMQCKIGNAWTFKHTPTKEL